MHDQAPDWDHTFLLGWYGPDGRAFLTTWDGPDPLIDVVVTGPFKTHGPPLLNNPVGDAQLHPIPDEFKSTSSKIAYATSLGGVYAIGWWVTETIMRRKG